VARNEDGEFELVLGNRQLMSVFFLMVVLLGLCFLIGYVFGRNSAPVLNGDSGEERPLVVPPAGPEETSSAPAPEPAAEPEPSTPPPAVQTATQQPPVKTGAKAPPPAPVKAAPPPAAKAAQPAPGSQPVQGRMYLQLAATSRDQADAMVDLLRSRGFTALAAQIPERPALFRVLVGPLDLNQESQMRGNLNSAGFPGNDAFRQVF
jgi:cell division septation protein DedD